MFHICRSLYIDTSEESVQEECEDVRVGGGVAPLDCTRPCVLACLLAPCSALSSCDTLATMGYHRIKRLFILGLGIAIFILGQLFYFYSRLQVVRIVYFYFPKVFMLLKVCKLKDI